MWPDPEPTTRGRCIRDGVDESEAQYPRPQAFPDAPDTTAQIAWRPCHRGNGQSGKLTAVVDLPATRAHPPPLTRNSSPANAANGHDFADRPHRPASQRPGGC